MEPATCGGLEVGFLPHAGSCPAGPSPKASVHYRGTPRRQISTVTVGHSTTVRQVKFAIITHKIDMMRYICAMLKVAHNHSHFGSTKKKKTAGVLVLLKNNANQRKKCKFQEVDCTLMCILGMLIQKIQFVGGEPTKTTKNNKKRFGGE